MSTDGVVNPWDSWGSFSQMSKILRMWRSRTHGCVCQQELNGGSPHHWWGEVAFKLVGLIWQNESYLMLLSFGLLHTYKATTLFDIDHSKVGFERERHPGASHQCLRTHTIPYTPVLAAQQHPHGARGGISQSGSPCLSELGQQQHWNPLSGENYPAFYTLLISHEKEM